MLAGLAVIMLLTLYLVNRVILKQVYAIGRAIRAQEEGNRDVRVASPTSDEIGKVAGAFNHMVDSLHKSQELFSRVFHASPTLFAISRPDGRGHYDVNEAWTATLGYQRDEAMTHSAVELGVWIDAKEHTRFMERLEGEGSVRDFETKFRTKSGKEIDVLVAGEYMKLGGERHLLEVSHDLTGRKAMEARLHQAQKMEAVGQLTGGVAHDFNNLLAVIMGNVGLLENQLGTEDDSLREILRASTRGAELTQRLLAFSRRQPLRPRSVDLCDLVAGMENLLTRTLGETIDISITSNTGLWKAMVDGSQLESAILNLAINARDAMPSGGKLGIETANVTLNEGFASSNLDVSPGNYVMLAVSDTGTGMAPNVLNRALEPFFTTKDVGMGSGLGLSMVYGLVKQSGGDLTIRSKKGQGTTVMLYLPTAGDEAEAGQTEHEARAEVPRGQGETVLVVEDDPAVRSVTKSLLESLGYRVLTAEDGRSGLDTLGMAPSVCLLLSDVVLPGGMDGPSLANEAKRQLPHLKVLFMSGYAESLVRGRSQLHDGDDLVNKPFHREGLAQRVRAALDR